MPAVFAIYPADTSVLVISRYAVWRMPFKGLARSPGPNDMLVTLSIMQVLVTAVDIVKAEPHVIK